MLLVVILNSSVVVTHFVMLFVKSHLNVHLRLRGREILFKCHCGLTPYETKVTTGPTTDDRLSNLEGKTFSLTSHVLDVKALPMPTAPPLIHNTESDNP